jgi:pilus assembly protein CpaE
MSAPALDSRPGSGVSLAAFVGDDDTTAKLNNIANFHWPGAVINRGSCHDAGSYLKTSASPDLLVVDLGESENPFEDLQPLAELCDPSTQVIAMGVVNDLALYKQFINAGVADYLVKPLSEEDLETALLAATFSELSSGETSTSEPNGKIVVTVGARGGVGASTVALNGAWMLAEEMGHKVALVDLDLQFGTAALSLDLVPSTGMIETLRHNWICMAKVLAVWSKNCAEASTGYGSTCHEAFVICIPACCAMPHMCMWCLTSHWPACATRCVSSTYSAISAGTARSA